MVSFEARQRRVPRDVQHAVHKKCSWIVDTAEAAEKTRQEISTTHVKTTLRLHAHGARGAAASKQAAVGAEAAAAAEGAARAGGCTAAGAGAAAPVAAAEARQYLGRRKQRA